ncbi:hypothetical protein N9J98_03145 [Flavobacteriaceae bacterium]|mgnify:FL=1|jgi:hypothetical protein|nr:hypothetical protein [Flavobacteriaceae bacterium]|tara:strand:+ start:808 stop:1101 length:294 start_codon:yes stop_codon:yes gene_type:complete
MSGLEAIIQGFVGSSFFIMIIFIYKNYKRKKAEKNQPDNYKEIKQKLEEKYSKEFNLDDDKIIISYFKPEDTWYIEQVKFGGNKILKSIKASEIENI